MTDLEMRRLCAEAIKYKGELRLYDPATNNAQAMALVKRFRLDIDSGFDSDDARADWQVTGTGGHAINADLNRAIVECVAKMQADTRDTSSDLPSNLRIGGE